MGKNAKDHRKKVQARNEQISNQKKKWQKAQQNWLMDLIEKEKAAGKFAAQPVAGDENQVIGATDPTLTEIKGPII
jgi:hypothetical protein